MEDLEEAIRVSRQAVKVTPEDHPDLAACLNNLGNKLESRYKRTGKMEDLEEAIRVSRQAVEVTPEDHPDLAAWLNNFFLFAFSSLVVVAFSSFFPVFSTVCVLSRD